MTFFILLRRAVVLRFHLSKYRNLLDKNKKICIDNDLLSAFMQIGKYNYGARSLESIIKMSNLNNARSYTKSNLPSNDLLNIHIDFKQFEKLMKENKIFPPDLIEPMAQEIHERWLAIEIEKGSDKPSMLPWNQLSDEYKNSNREQALDNLQKLKIYNYRVVSVYETEKSITQFSEETIEAMAENEHERWMNEKLRKGWTYGKVRNDTLKKHPLLLPWKELDNATKELDRNAVRVIPELLKNTGYAIEKIEEKE